MNALRVGIDQRQLLLDHLGTTKDMRSERVLQCVVLPGLQLLQERPAQLEHLIVDEPPHHDQRRLELQPRGQLVEHRLGNRPERTAGQFGCDRCRRTKQRSRLNCRDIGQPAGLRLGT
ncbi:MAG: hypothetical protein ACK5YV_09340 [Betaproteobacteria bacterium]